MCHDHATLAPVPIMEDGKTRHVSISLILATQECCPIPGLDDLEAIVKEIGHRQCSLGAPFPIINPSVIDADKPAGRQLQVNRLCAVEMHLVAGNFIDVPNEKILVPAMPQLAVLAIIEVEGIQEDKVHVVGIGSKDVLEIGRASCRERVCQSV